MSFRRQPGRVSQVCPDASCVSASPFEQKKRSTPPHLDDIHGYHRGRRQSGEMRRPFLTAVGVHPPLKVVPVCAEPPELLMYTPEKSRKSLPLLLDGNLPNRRARRQSGNVPLVPWPLCPPDVFPTGCFVLQLQPKTSRQRSSAMVRRFTPPAVLRPQVMLTFLLFCPHVSVPPPVLLEVLQL